MADCIDNEADISMEPVKVPVSPQRSKLEDLVQLWTSCRICGSPRPQNL
jgi:hypothetical protein